ncbi:MFS family permease [Neobacillus niacini]|nr:MFS family permease [Neobacillus niacini]
MSSTVPQYLALSTNSGKGTKLFSQIIMLNGVTVLFVQYPLTRIGKKYSASVSIMFSALIMGTRLIGFGISEQSWQVYVATIIFTIGEVLMFSMWDIFIDEVAKPELKGTYFGAVGFSELGGVIGPLAGGILLNYYGSSQGNIMFSILSGICILGFPIMYFVAIFIKKRSKTLGKIYS